MVELTQKQKIFVKEYLIDLNATQAAIRAGYSEKRAGEIAYQLMQKENIKKALKKEMEKREKRTDITQDKVLREIANIAFANATDFAKIILQKNTEEIWDDETQKIVEKKVCKQSVEIFNTDILTNDKKSAIAELSTGKFGACFKLCDKVKALELLGRHLGLFKDKCDMSGSVTITLGEELDKYSN